MLEFAYKLALENKIDLQSPTLSHALPTIGPAPYVIMYLQLDYTSIQLGNAAAWIIVNEHLICTCQNVKKSDLSYDSLFLSPKCLPENMKMPKKANGSF